MQEEIGNLVHSAISYGVRLKERLEKGEALHLEQEQGELKGLLLSDAEARRWTDFGGERGHDPSVSVIGATRMGDPGRRGADFFLGIRYALACWLDEIFIVDSPWDTQWNEHKLEVALYGTNDRAWKFWEQARRAETRPGSDALEVFFLCVMLGFRGDLREQPDKLQDWVRNTQARIAKSQSQEWPVPAELDPPIYVPPLRGREKLQKAILAGGVLLLILIPIVAFLVVIRFGGE